MEIYQHDSAATFRFVLRGELSADVACELGHAWNTTKSILDGKELIVDISGVTRADPAGVELLLRMRGAGACLNAALPPESEELLRSLGMPVAAPRRRSRGGWVLRVLRCAGL